LIDDYCSIGACTEDAAPFLIFAGQTEKEMGPDSRKSFFL
jgi:hypothetical protein